MTRRSTRTYLRSHSTGTVVAAIALVFALGGAAVALPGTGKVASNDIAKNAVDSKQIKAGAVETSHLAKNAATGAKVAESTLGKVPSAGSADNALRAQTSGHSDTTTTARSVNGVEMRGISFRAGVGTIADIVSLGGLTIRASCFAPEFRLDAETSVRDATLTAASIFGPGEPGPGFTEFVSEPDFDDSIDLSQLGLGRQLLTVQYSRPPIGGGRLPAAAVTVEIQVSLGANPECVISGHAMRS